MCTQYFYFIQLTDKGGSKKISDRESKQRLVRLAMQIDLYFKRNNLLLIIAVVTIQLADHLCDATGASRWWHYRVQVSCFLLPVVTMDIFNSKTRVKRQCGAVLHSYERFPELQAELFESGDTRTSHLPVNKPLPSITSPHLRRTKQELVTSHVAADKTNPELWAKWVMIPWPWS